MWMSSERNGRSYEFCSRPSNSTDSGYHVYRADIDGSEVVRVIDDGQSQDLIDAVDANCKYLGYVRAWRADD